MKESEYSQKAYDKMVKEASPNSPVFANCLKAFVSGGIICVLGQGLLNFIGQYSFAEDEAALLTSIILILLSAILTGLGLYGKLGKYCGAGTIVPITGFANSVVSPAIEFKKEASVIIGTNK